jgi:hypothetical protein
MDAPFLRIHNTDGQHMTTIHVPIHIFRFLFHGMNGVLKQAFQFPFHIPLWLPCGRFQLNVLGFDFKNVKKNDKQKLSFKEKPTTKAKSDYRG